MGSVYCFYGIICRRLLVALVACAVGRGAVEVENQKS